MAAWLYYQDAQSVKKGSTLGKVTEGIGLRYASATNPLAENSSKRSHLVVPATFWLNRTASGKVKGDIPTKLISPRSTLNNCGSSSKLYWHNQRPSGVVQELLLTSVVRNLRVRKSLPCVPTYHLTEKIAPGEYTCISTTVANMTGLSISSNTKPVIQLISRLMNPMSWLCSLGNCLAKAPRKNSGFFACSQASAHW